MSNKDKFNAVDYTALEKMSTQELEDLLRKTFDQPALSDEDSNMILAITEVLDIRENNGGVPKAERHPCGFSNAGDGQPTHTGSGCAGPPLPFTILVSLIRAAGSRSFSTAAGCRTSAISSPFRTRDMSITSI